MRVLLRYFTPTPSLSFQRLDRAEKVIDLAVGDWCSLRASSFGSGKMRICHLAKNSPKCHIADLKAAVENACPAQVALKASLEDG